MPDIPQRARSLTEYRQLSHGLAEAARLAYCDAPLKVQPGDVIISPYGKCGTTMLQQIFHTLRTRGDTDFVDISAVVPWIELSPLLGIDLNAPQRALPRGFKSHLCHDSLPAGARYVVPLRDPMDAFVSMYHFMVGWLIEPGAIPIEEFFEAWVEGGGPEGQGYWRHLASWWAVKDRPDVLLTTYGNMLRDKAGQIRRLAAFCDIPLDDELLALTLERSSRDYMLRHKCQFDDATLRHFSESKAGLPHGSDSAKVRAGSDGNHRSEVPPSIVARMDRIWHERVAGPLGLADFNALEQRL